MDSIMVPVGMIMSYGVRNGMDRQTLNVNLVWLTIDNVAKTFQFP